MANGLLETISFALADAVLNNPLLPNGVRETCKRGKLFAALKHTMSSRRLLDIDSMAYLSFQLLLPLDSLPLVGQVVGIRDNNRRGHWRTNGPMMPDWDMATPSVLRQVARICKGPCTPRAGWHIRGTSSRYLADVGE